MPTIIWAWAQMTGFGVPVVPEVWQMRTGSPGACRNGGGTGTSPDGTVASIEDTQKRSSSGVSASLRRASLTSSVWSPTGAVSLR